MKAHLGAVLTTGLAALALALALLQAVVASHGIQVAQLPAATPPGPTNRYSAPGNRSAVPWAPFDKAQDQKPVPPESPEGRSPERRQEERRSPPPPSRFRGMPPRIGPHPARKAVA
ncbi:MAG TPA: hypothetical protein VFA79_07490 [Myxococcales bacterium]|nr:hypothetical protein [Myxococcales bacterium]